MKWKDQLSKGLSAFLNLPPSIQMDEQWKKTIRQIKEDVDEPIIVMIAGEFKAGKSTFINALLGDEVLTADVTPATAVVTKLTYGPQKKIIGHFQNSERKEFDQAWLEQLTAERSGAGELIRKTLHYVELQLPYKFLQSITILDTPGLNSTQAHHTRATEMFLQRADYTIWLFHYQNAGTSTELEVLQKLRASDAKVVGIVNAIDLHDEEEGDLDEFLQDSKRRMQGLVDELYGVSARNALEAKRDGDQEALKWSRWQSVEALMDEIHTDTSFKADRILTKLTEPLRSLDQKLLEQKHAFSLHRLGPQIVTFVEESHPAYVAGREEAEKNSIKWREEFQSWTCLFQQDYSSVEHLKGLIQSLEKAREGNEIAAAVTVPFPGDQWKQAVLPDFGKYQALYEPYIDLIEHASSQRDLLDDTWLALSGRSFFGKQKIEQLALDQKQYNQLIEKVRSQRNDLAQKRSAIERQLSQFGDRLKEYIQAVCESIVERVNKEREWSNEARETLMQITKEWEPFRLQEIDAFFAWLSIYDRAMRPFFEDTDEMLLSLGSFQKCKYFYDNSKALHMALPFAQAIEAYQGLLSTQALQPIDWKPGIVGRILGSSVSGDQILPVPESLDFDSRGVLNRIARNRKNVSRLAILAVLATALIMAVKSCQESEEASSGGNNNEISQNSSILESPPAADALEGSQEPGEISLHSEQAKEFVAQMHDQLTLHQQGLKQFNTGEWFTYDAWQQFMPFYQSLNGWEKQSVQISDVQTPAPSIFLVMTKETYQASHVTKIFTGVYEITVDGSHAPVISKFTYKLEQTDQPVDQAAMSAFLANYRDGYMSALNSGDFSYAQEFLAQGGAAYKELLEYTHSISGKGYRFDFEQFFINDIAQDAEGRYKASTTEIFTFTDHLGESTRYTRQKEYALDVLSTNDFRIQTITILDTKKEAVPSVTSMSDSFAPSNAIRENRPPDIPAQERTIDLVSGDEIQNFFTVYYADFVHAFNGAGSETVAGYYVPGGSGYEEHRGYLDNAVKKQMRMENLQFNIEQVTPQDDQHYMVHLYLEDRYRYLDGTGDQKKIRASYLIKITDGGSMQIESLPSLNILEKTTQ
ncbi:dynamin family protein [Brevibacillus centrosporus]|uniref:dynamin family protein n=1 Tax=Brevibacillus centrosporus TaxID=54910 RepID=UPI003D2298D5